MGHFWTPFWPPFFSSWTATPQISLVWRVKSPYPGQNLLRTCQKGVQKWVKKQLKMTTFWTPFWPPIFSSWQLPLKYPLYDGSNWPMLAKPVKKGSKKGSKTVKKGSKTGILGLGSPKMANPRQFGQKGPKKHTNNVSRFCDFVAPESFKTDQPEKPCFWPCQKWPPKWSK